MKRKVRNIYEDDVFEVQVGDYVGFKCDIEQWGQIIDLGYQRATIENKSGFEGEYIGGETQTVVPLERLWQEG